MSSPECFELVKKINGTDKSKGQGFLQWMLPSWGGWYSTQPNVSNEEIVPDDTTDAETSINSTEFKNLDVLDNADNDTLLKRDSVFAQMNFSLSQGSFVLLGQQSSQGERRNGTPPHDLWKPVTELEFFDVPTKSETRPRTGSLLCEVKLGALYLHDRVFTGTSFPHIIAPQSRDVNFMYTETSGSPIIPFPAFLSQKCETDSSAPLFELLYEKKPPTVQGDNRLVTTRSLDVVHNHKKRCIPDFFCLHHGKVSFSDLKLTAAAHVHDNVYEEQTKAELKEMLDRILEGIDKPYLVIKLTARCPKMGLLKKFCGIIEKNEEALKFEIINMNKGPSKPKRISH